MSTRTREPDGTARRSALLGNALDVLRVQRTPAGRHRMVLRSQVPFVGLITVALGAMVLAGVDAGALPVIVVCWVSLLTMTALACFTPWERTPEIVALVVASLDLVLVGILSATLQNDYPGIEILVGLPVIVLAFAIGAAGLTAAIVGTVFVALYPVIVGERVPRSAAGWIDLALFPGVIIVLAVVIFVGSDLLQRVHARLERTIDQRERATRESEDQRAVIFTVLDAMDVGTAFVEPDGGLYFTNLAFRGLIQRSVIDPETRSGTRVYGDDRVTPLGPDEQMMAQAARGEYFDSRLYWIGEPGDQRAVLVTARPVFGREEKQIGAAFVSKDVTELTDAIRAREEFLAGISHELRTPLTSIIGYLEVIQDSIDAEAVGIDRELAVVQRNANQLMIRIGDLLHVADDSLTLRRRSVDVPTIVRQASDATLVRARESGIAFEAELCGPFVATIDPNRFAQVLDNLLTNAVKYTPRGGIVRVTLAAGEENLVLTVADSGVGIDVNDLRHVFDRFYRTESARDGSVSGAGLGLAIVRSIVQAHGGTVTAQSEVGVGSAFTVTLPRVT